MSKDYADAYDRTYAFFKDYSQEAGFVRDAIRAFRPAARTVLDIACGTGTHIIELARMGFVVAGLDLDPDILQVARRKAQAQEVAVELFQGDMRAFQLPRRFDVAINMFYSFQNVLYTEEEQINCLRAIHQALHDGGLLILEILPEENNLRQYPTGQVFLVHQEEQGDGSELIVTSENRIVDQELKEIIFTYKTQKDGETIKVEEIVSPLRRMYVKQVPSRFAQGGFRIVRQFGDCDLRVPFGPESRKLVIVAEKEPLS